MRSNIDWNNLGFNYIKTDYRFISNFKEGKWDDGKLITDENIVLNESAQVLQYSQTCFEGLKAYNTVNNKTVCFRLDLNAKRMFDSCTRLAMPTFPKEKFIEAVLKTVKANIDFVPPYGFGASLYIRPFMFGSNAVIGVKPASEFQFRIFATPVGAYFKSGIKPIILKVSEYDRAAPRGTGHVKAGLNYAMSFYAYEEAHKQGCDENIYLDSTTRTKIEESGGANIIFIDKNNNVITPKSNTILPSITRHSLLYVAEHYLNLKVEEREVELKEISDFKECCLCGTAAVLSPVGKIVNNDRDIFFPSGMEKMGEISKKLYDTLLGIQFGKIKAPSGWIFELE